jgi:hypothetical protein
MGNVGHLSDVVEAFHLDRHAAALVGLTMAICRPRWRTQPIIDNGHYHVFIGQATARGVRGHLSWSAVPYREIAPCVELALPKAGQELSSANIFGVKLLAVLSNHVDNSARQQSSGISTIGRCRKCLLVLGEKISGSSVRLRSCAECNAAGPFLLDAR